MAARATAASSARLVNGRFTASTATPRWRSSFTTPSQHHAPCHAPWMSTTCPTVSLPLSPRRVELCRHLAVPLDRDQVHTVEGSRGADLLGQLESDLHAGGVVSVN